MQGVKSLFVLDALETADIATIRPSFRGKERESEYREGEKERGIWYFCHTEWVVVEIVVVEVVSLLCLSVCVSYGFL